MVPQRLRGGIVECGGLFTLPALSLEGSFEGPPLLRWQPKLPIDRGGAESSTGKGVPRCGVTILPLRW